MADEHPEADLLERARDGDDEAFAALCARHEARLRRRVELRLSPAVRRRFAASDVLQLAHLEAHGKLPDFEDRGQGSFGRWLARIVDLKAKELVRHHAGTAKRAVQAELTRPGRPTLGAFHGADTSPSQAAMGSELRGAIRRAIENLPPNYREVVELRQVRGLSTAEVAERLGKTPDMVKGTYSRALAKLARDLKLHGSDA